MILLLLLLISVFTSSFVYSAVIPRKRTIFNINDLDGYLLLIIGEYLECPQMQLGMMNTIFYRLFLKEYPYRNLLKKRHGIHELTDSKSDSDLAIFSQLALTTNRLHLYRSLCSHLFDKSSFSENRHLLLRYLLRIKKEIGFLPSRIRAPETYDEDGNIEILRLDPDIDFIIEYVIERYYSFRRFCSGLDMGVGKRFMERIIKIDEALYRRIEQFLGLEVEPNADFNQEKAAKNVYTRLMGFLSTTPKYYSDFLLMSVLGGVPDAWYFPLILNFTLDARSLVLMKMFLFTNLIGSAEDIHRVYETMNRLLSGVTDQEVRYFKLLNEIRFAENVDNSFILDEMQELKFGFAHFYCIVAAAAITKNFDLLRQIKNNFLVSHWNRLINELRITEHGIYIFFALISIYSAAEIEAYFDGLSCINWILYFYAIDCFEYSKETARVTLNLILTPKFGSKGLPSSFKMVFNVNPEKISQKRLILAQIANIFFIQHSERDEESLVRLMEGYKDLNALAFEYFSIILKASSAFLKSVTKSELLLNTVKSLELQFSIDCTEFARLLESDISSLRGILVSFPIRESLLLVKSFRQIRNLEAFLGIDISDIMMRHVIPDTEAGQLSLGNYYKLSTALRYWLKSPQKHRMSELNPKHFMFFLFLKNEIDLEDSKFLDSL